MTAGTFYKTMQSNWKDLTQQCWASPTLGITDTGHLCYSYELIVDVFVTRDEMQYDEAIEWVEYNIVPLHMYGGFSLVYTDI